MSEDSHATVPHYEENLNVEDFHEMLNSQKTKDEHVAWSVLLLDSLDEMMEYLSSLKTPHKTILPLKFA